MCPVGCLKCVQCAYRLGFADGVKGRVRVPQSAVCTARLGGDGLACTRSEHADGGHVYYSTSGVADRHSASSGGEG